MSLIRLWSEHHATQPLHMVKTEEVSILENIFDNKISYWWEVMVAFTIVRNSNYSISLNEMLGVSSHFSSVTKTRDLKFFKAKTKSESTPNSMILPYDTNQSGFDGKILLLNEFGNSENNENKLLIYSQCKIKMPLKSSLEEIIMSVIVNCLLDHFAVHRNVLIDHVIIVLYVWDDIQFENDTKQSFLNNMVTNLLEKEFKKKKKLPTKFDEKLVKEYIEKNWQNIFVLNKEKLKKILIYSFLPFPELFSEIESSERE
jgi:hypothetical protein